MMVEALHNQSDMSQGFVLEHLYVWTVLGVYFCSLVPLVSFWLLNLLNVVVQYPVLHRTRLVLVGPAEE
jgi:hypothetical protein